MHIIELLVGDACYRREGVVFDCEKENERGLSVGLRRSAWVLMNWSRKLTSIPKRFARKRYGYWSPIVISFILFGHCTTIETAHEIGDISTQRRKAS